MEILLVKHHIGMWARASCNKCGAHRLPDDNVNVTVNYQFLTAHEGFLYGVLPKAGCTPTSDISDELFQM